MNTSGRVSDSLLTAHRFHADLVHCKQPWATH